MRIQIPADKVLPSGAFTIYESHTDGRTWVIPAWIEVPTGTKFSDIILTGIPKIKQQQEKEYKVTGSKGKIYTVKVDKRGSASCTCIGFSYHRDCKHIQKIKQKQIN